jgi:hypothetical protein
VLHWLCGQHDPVTAADLRDALRPVISRVPALGGTLRRGLNRAVEANAVFVLVAVLRKPAGSLIYRATRRGGRRRTTTISCGT